MISGQSFMWACCEKGGGLWYLQSRLCEQRLAHSSRVMPGSSVRRSAFHDFGTSSLPSERWKSLSALRWTADTSPQTHTHTHIQVDDNMQKIIYYIANQPTLLHLPTPYHRVHSSLDLHCMSKSIGTSDWTNGDFIMELVPLSLFLENFP